MFFRGNFLFVSDGPFKRRNPRKLLKLGKFKFKRYGKDNLIFGNEEKITSEALNRLFPENAIRNPQAYSEIFSRRVSECSLFLSPIACGLSAEGVIGRRNLQEFVIKLTPRIGEFHAVENFKLLLEMTKKSSTISNCFFAPFVAESIKGLIGRVGDLSLKESCHLLTTLGNLKTKNLLSQDGRTLVIKLLKKINFNFARLEIDQIILVIQGLADLKVRDVFFIKQVSEIFLHENEVKIALQKLHI